MHPSIHACMHACIHTSMHACIHACMHAYMHAIHYVTLRYVALRCITLHYITLHTLHTYLPTYIRICLHTYIHTYIPTYLHTYLPIYLPTYIHVYYTCIQLYIYTWLYMYYWYLYHKHSCFHHPPSHGIFVSRWWWSVDWSSMLDEVGKNFAVRHGHERGDPGSWVAESWVPPMTGNGETGNHSTYIYKNADDWGMVFWYCFTVFYPHDRNYFLFFLGLKTILWLGIPAR